MASIEFVDLVGNTSSDTEVEEPGRAFTTSFTGQSDAFGPEDPGDADECMIVDGRKIPRHPVSIKRWTGWNHLVKTDVQTQADAHRADKENVQPADPMEEDAEEDEQDEGSIPDDPDVMSAKEEITRSLSYWIPLGHVKNKFWTYEPYRGPKGEKVELLYCTTRGECEKAAKRFLSEQIIGFDMEWKPRKRRKAIQDNVSVIQIASETTIALFHIALIKGKTANDVLAPSLRKLIEGSRYTKCGVAINTADGNRLRQWMKLEPRGMFELSYFHRVVSYCKQDPKQVKKKYLSLSNLCQIWLGGPLHKGSVRTSNWTQRLTQEQIRYAASDAYAGVRIYHAIEKKRQSFDRPPPVPAHTELNLPLLINDPNWEPPPEKSPHKNASNMENVTVPGGPPLSTEHNADASPTRPERPKFWVPEPIFDAPAPPQPSCIAAHDEHQQIAKSPAKQQSISTMPEDPVARRLFNALGAKRRQISLRTGMNEKMIISDPALRGIAERQPRTQSDLASLPAAADFGKHGDFDLVAFVQRHAPLPSA